MVPTRAWELTIPPVLLTCIIHHPFVVCRMAVERPVLTVSELNRQIRSWLEHEIGHVRVEGELSNLSKPASGHFYFTLKDASAQIRCVFFRNRHAESDFIRLQNGQQVLIFGNLSLYEARGDYQLIVELIQDAGEGDLFRQFELLKTKLSALGLFDATRKKTIPAFPSKIGIITSASGAALRDILSTLERRYPIADIVVYACEVQGKTAAQQLIQAIHQANVEKRCDVLILARGGGSIEDLWSFNDELLAHAIAKSELPIVSGVGHETDFTIADFVADLRAATPTGAAEAVTPNRLDLIAYLQTIEERLLSSMSRSMQHCQLRLQHETNKLASPKRLISNYWQNLDHLRIHLVHLIEQFVTQKRHDLLLIKNSLETKSPTVQLHQALLNVQSLENKLVQYVTIKFNQSKQMLTSQLATLHAVSPLATLDRGYAIVTGHQKILLDSELVQLGDTVDIRLAKGHLRGIICEKN